MQITIGDYLIKRLKQIGIDHVIGVPGDFNLQWLEQIRNQDQIEFVSASNELNAAYAADGYARERGISALCVTYGVGDLGAIAGVAGSAAEHVPVIVISGSPPLYVTKHRLNVHHSLANGDYTNMKNAYAEFTDCQVQITPNNAAEEIDRAISIALRHKKPTYIQLPSNITYLNITIPDDYNLPIIQHPSDKERLESALTCIKELYSKANKPAVLIDRDVDRFDVTQEIMEFIEKTNTPFAYLSTGKSILSDQHSLAAGLYKGDDSDPGVQSMVEESDFLLTVAPRFIEWNSAQYSHKLPEHNTVYLGLFETFVGNTVFEAVAVRELLQKLNESDIFNKPSQSFKKFEKKSVDSTYQKDQKLTHDVFWPIVSKMFQENDLIIGETGTANLALSGISFPDKAKYIGSQIWGAIGFTLPALYGSLLANPNRRNILFIGDGSFQVTAQEFSNILHHKMKPIIFVINNKGYTIERYIMGINASYNDIPAWRYAKLPEVWNGNPEMVCCEISTTDELKIAIQKAEQSPHGALIEVHMDAKDAPDALKNFGPNVAEFNYGERGPENK